MIRIMRPVLALALPLSPTPAPFPAGRFGGGGEVGGVGRPLWCLSRSISKTRIWNTRMILFPPPTGSLLRGFSAFACPAYDQFRPTTKRTSRHFDEYRHCRITRFRWLGARSLGQVLAGHSAFPHICRTDPQDSTFPLLPVLLVSGGERTHIH